MTTPDPSRPVPALPTTAYAVYWPAADETPECYEPCVDETEALSTAGIYGDAVAVTAPITYGEWTPISVSPVADLTDEGDHR